MTHHDIITTLSAENAALKSEVNRLSNQILEITTQLDWFKRQIFGQKSERVIPTHDAQCTLDIGDVPVGVPIVSTQEIPAHSRTNPNANKTPHGRDEIPAHIPRHTITIKPDFDTTDMEQVAEKITEQLEYTPPSFFVNRYVRPVYATIANGARTLVCPDLPALCIDKGKLGPTIVAHTIISKCQDAIPHYRIAKMISRDCAMSIPESTIRDGFKQGAFLLGALVDRLEEIALKSSYLQMDESSIKVIIHPTHGKTHPGYMIVRHAVLEKIILFDYQKTRNVKITKELLSDFKGTLQTDGLNLYPIVCEDLRLIAAGCMDHCRRGFDKALTNDKARASHALDLIRPLYEVEETARNSALDTQQRLQLRTEKSEPVFQAFIAWCKETLLEVTPKSPLGKAIIYTLNRKDSLGRFLEDEKVELSNILIENAIRPLAIGRKNFMFAGSEDGAKRLAIAYSIIGTAIKNGLNTRNYLNNVLAELPKRLSKNIDDLLPMNWKDPTVS